jgi:hypothetical protein
MLFLTEQLGFFGLKFGVGDGAGVLGPLQINQLLADRGLGGFVLGAAAQGETNATAQDGTSQPQKSGDYQFPYLHPQRVIPFHERGD